MREIKFRAWNKKEKVMINSVEDEFAVVSNGWIILEDNNDDYGTSWFSDRNHIEDPANLILMQYTGLKDKNGKEIYESDLLKRPDGAIEEIVFDAGSFCIKYKDSIFDFIAEDNNLEIIGNIYEHPNLINVQP